MDCRNADALNGITEQLARRVVAAESLVLINTFNAADVLDREAQDVADEQVVAGGILDEVRHDQVGGLLQHPAQQRRKAAQVALRQRDGVERPLPQRLARAAQRFRHSRPGHQ